MLLPTTATFVHVCFHKAESFFKSLKVEWVYRQNYRLRSEAELSIFQWIRTWYNKERIPQHWTIKQWKNLKTKCITKNHRHDSYPRAHFFVASPMLNWKKSGAHIRINISPILYLALSVHNQQFAQLWMF